MQYSISALTTVADCDALLQMADKDQRELNFKRSQEDRAYENTSSGSSGVDAKLSATISEIAGLETVIASLPEGTSKQNLVDKIEALKHTKYSLEKRRRRYGSVAKLQKEFDITSIEKQLAEMVSYIDAVTQRKADLASV